MSAVVGAVCGTVKFTCSGDIKAVCQVGREGGRFPLLSLLGLTSLAAWQRWEVGSVSGDEPAGVCCCWLVWAPGLASVFLCQWGRGASAVLRFWP